MEKLRDIKPLVEIPDFSFYLYILIIFIATLLLIVVIYGVIKFVSKKREVSRKEKILKELKSLDLSNPKEVAYKLTKLGKLVIKDEAHFRIYEDLVKKLTPYKYKKEVEPLSKDIKNEIKLFIRVAGE